MPEIDTATLSARLDDLRHKQLYLVEMTMVTPTEDPLPVLGPHLDEHLAWLVAREDDGRLFLSGQLSDETGWDGSGMAIVRAASREAADADAQTEPFCRAGIRKNTVRGWSLNEGSLTVRLSLFRDSVEIL